MVSKRLLLICLGSLFFFLRPAPVLAVSIDSAPYSAVSGYQIGIFGSGFGNSSGTVTILGKPAAIVEWHDQFIRTLVPPVSPSSGNLVVTTPTGSASHTITIYEIDPRWLTTAKSLVNIAAGKAVYYYNSSGEYYIGSSPSIELTRNTTGGRVQMTASGILAVNLGANFNETVWWNYFHDADWYNHADWSDGSATPAQYVFEGSVDSTDGLNGTWVQLSEVTGNVRRSRTHAVRMTGQKWLRMRTVSLNGNGTAYNIGEVRIYRILPGSTGTGINSVGIFGDSNTYGDFSDTSFNVSTLYSQQKNDGSTLLFSPMGLVGATAEGLGAAATGQYSLDTLLKENPDLHYIAAAFGTNDSLSQWNTQYYQSRLHEGITQIITAGRIPIIPRLVDTDPARDGYGSFEYKQVILKAIDEETANFRLVPGPDTYTEFRYNILYQGGNFLNDDGTHHSGSGGDKINRLWANTLYRLGATPPLPTSAAISGDANGDGRVDGIDYVIWLNHYGTTASPSAGAASGDFNNDGKTDGIDYVLWLNNYGK